MFKKKTRLNSYQQAVIALPDVFEFQITKDMDFLVIGCDGIWDCVDTQVLCEFISERIDEKVSLTKILKEVFDQLISNSPYCINFDNSSENWHG